jgi:hypothetical protein
VRRLVVIAISVMTGGAGAMGLLGSNLSVGMMLGLTGVSAVIRGIQALRLTKLETQHLRHQGPFRRTSTALRSHFVGDIGYLCPDNALRPLRGIVVSFRVQFLDASAAVVRERLVKARREIVTMNGFDYCECCECVA